MAFVACVEVVSTVTHTRAPTQVKRIGSDALEQAQYNEDMNQYAVAEVMYKQVRGGGLVAPVLMVSSERRQGRSSAWPVLAAHLAWACMHRALTHASRPRAARARPRSPPPSAPPHPLLAPCVLTTCFQHVLPMRCRAAAPTPGLLHQQAHLP